MYLKVMYGGRAIDDFDRRVLKTYMDEYMGDFIFDTFQPFHFYHNSEVDYKIPEDGSRDSYIGKSLFTLVKLIARYLKTFYMTLI